MNLNSDISSYIKSVVPEWQPEQGPSQRFIKRITRHLTSTEFPKSINATSCILKLETLIRVCHYISEMASKLCNAQSNLKSISEAELKIYKSGLKNIGLKEDSVEHNNNDILTKIVTLVKKYSIPLRKDLNTRNKDGLTPFLQAAKNCDLERMKFLRSLGASITFTDNDGNTPLHLAIKSNDKELVTFLLKEGANINAKNNDGETPLSIAIDNNCSDYCKILIKNHADIHITYNDGMTALHLACQKRLIDVVEELVQDKTTLDVKDNDGDTPLHILTSTDIDNPEDTKMALQCLKLLIHNGAKVNIVGKDKKSPLHNAAENGFDEALKEILNLPEAIEAINDKDNKGNTPLHLATEMNFDSGEVVRAVNCVNLLIESGAKVNILNNYKSTPLHNVVVYEQLDLLEKFLKLPSGKEVINQQDSTRNTALHLAILNHNKEKGDAFTKVLIQNNANVNLVNHFGNTPLLLAVREKFEKSTLLLIQNNADLGVVNNQRKNALHLACENDLTGFARILIRKKPELLNALDENLDTPLNLAIENKSEKCAKFLILSNAVTDIPNKDGAVALNIACANGLTEIVEALMFNKPELINHQNTYHNTPLMLSIINNYEECAQLLISNGCDLSIRDDDGETALHLACKNGLTDVVKKLIKVSPELINLTCDNGKTALVVALLSGNEECAELLIENGASLDILYGNRENVVLAASSRGLLKTLTILLDKKPELLNAKDANCNTPLINATKFNHAQCFYFLVRKGANLNDSNNDLKTLLHFACETGQLNIVKTLASFVNLNPRNKYNNTPVNRAINCGHKECAKFLIENGAETSDDERLKFKALNKPLKEASIVDYKNYSVSLKNLIKENFKSFLDSIEDKFPVGVEDTVFDNFSEEVDKLSKKVPKNQEESLNLAVNFQDLYLQFLFNSQKELIEKNIKGNKEERLEEFSETLDQLYTSHREIQKSRLVKELNHSAHSLDKIFKKQRLDIKNELDVFSDFLNNRFKLAPQFKKIKNSDLFQNGGVCFGASLVHSSRKIHNKAESGIQPCESSRFMQAAIDLRYFHDNQFGNRISEFNKEEKKLISETETLLNKRSFNKSTIKIRCDKSLDILNKFAKLKNDGLLYQWIKKEKQNFNYSEESYLKLKGKIDNLTRVNSNDVLVYSLKNKLKINADKVDHIINLRITSFITNIEKLITTLDREKSPHFCIKLQGESESIGHVITCNLSLPYEIQDVNLPGYTSIKTTDINQFQRYLILYFLEASPGNYTHVEELYHISKK